MDMSSIQTTRKEQILHGLRLLNALNELLIGKFYFELHRMAAFSTKNNKVS